jgi:hypothetical protein
MQKEKPAIPHAHVRKKTGAEEASPRLKGESRLTPQIKSSLAPVCQHGGPGVSAVDHDHAEQ